MSNVVSLREAKYLACLTFFLTIFSISASCQKAKKDKWTEDISVKKAVLLLKKNKELQVLDVRTMDEVKSSGTINATNFKHIDWHSKDFKKNVAQLNKEKPVLVYCASGMRSKMAMAALNKMGFSKLYNLKGGYNSWKSL